MSKIKKNDDFINITSNITSFSHAYLFNVNSLNIASPYIKEFAKMIITKDSVSDEEKNDISYKIDHDEFDDLYIVNPNTIGINTEEINKLLSYMETKSLRENGKRVYIIYGFERLSRDVSNKILKFLEEPNDNIYALIMSENVDRILPTIISRCQMITLTFDKEDFSSDYINLIKNFINDLFKRKTAIIAYENDLYYEIIGDRIKFYNFFDCLEKILSENINKKCGREIKSEYNVDCIQNLPLNNLLKILDITNYLKSIIKKNINLNLLLDRYIIEVVKELVVCQK